MRKVIGSRNGDSLKSSGNFIYDNTTNGYVVPEYIKLSDADAWNFYRNNEWLNSVVNRIVNDCTKIGLTVVLRDNTKKMRPRHNRIVQTINDFLTKPNPNKESFRELREKTIRDFLVYGRMCYEKVNENNVLKEIYAVRSSSVEVMADQFGNLPDNKTYRQRSPDGRFIYFNKNEMIFKTFRPYAGSMYGEKPLDTLANAVAADILRAAYNSNFFVNGAEASGLVSLEGMSKGELAKFRQYWKDNHQGVNKAHRILAVNVPVNWVRMAITNRDMQFSEYGKELMMKIFAVYAMQPFVMGAIDGTTGKLNSSEQYQIYKDQALKPILAKEAHTYTQEILHDGFGLHEFEVQFQGVDLADAIKQAEIDRNDIMNAILTINEVRARRGLAPVPWGDTPMNTAPGGGQVDPETGQIIPPSQQGTTGKPVKKPAKEPVEEEDDDEKSVDDFSSDEFIDDVEDTLKYVSSHMGIKNAVKSLNRFMDVGKYSGDSEIRMKLNKVLSSIQERYKDVQNYELEDVVEFIGKLVKNAKVSR